MTPLRAILTVVCPPLAVVHHGWHAVVVVGILTFVGWIPGMIAALLMNTIGD